MIELIDGSAIQLFRCNEFVAWRHQRMHDDDLRCVARGDCQACSASLERRHAFFEDGVGRVSDAGVDISEGLQAKQRCGVVHIVKHK